ncbi:MAG: hypothetical protein AAFO04_24110 [Cyanobacteria bacterium J06592_8]
MTSERLQDKPLQELKAIALEELNLSKDEIREFGKLTHKATWVNAILEHRDGLKQLSLTDSVSIQENTEDSPAAIKPVMSEVEVSADDTEISTQSKAIAHSQGDAIANVQTLSYEQKKTLCSEVDITTVEAEPVSYQVILEPPEGLEPVNTNKFFQTPKPKKLPFQDFFVRLFSPPKVFETPQLELERLGLT